MKKREVSQRETDLKSQPFGWRCGAGALDSVVMGSGSSVPATLDKDAAKSAAGSSWSVEHEYKFDEMAVQGQITRQQFLKVSSVGV